jgi:hypothetical protein
MVRQAHTYLVGAMSGATLIAAAIAVFVVLVSALVFQDWPIAGLGGSGDDSAVSSEQSAGSGAGDGAAANGTAIGARGAAATHLPGQGARQADPNSIATGAPGGKTFQPGNETPGGEPGAGAGRPDGAADSPASPDAGGGAGADGSAGGGGAGGGGGGAGGGSTAGSGSGSSTSGNVANTVNETVHQVDETVTGGALEKTGVTGATEEVVNGVVGPESTVGQVVDGVADTVGGLLHPNR